MTDSTAKESGPSQPVGHEFRLKSRIIASTLAICVLVAGFGGWAISAQLSGAIIAQGTVVVEKNVKKVQHNEGGIVAEISVANGDFVEGGDVLIKLDDTQVRAALGVLNSQIAELLGREARLLAERDGLDAIKFPSLTADLNSGLTAGGSGIWKGEQRVFMDNKTTRKSQKQQLDLRIVQLREEIKGIEAQRASKKRESAFLHRQLKRTRGLYQKQLAPVTRVEALEREAERNRGATAELNTRVARTRGQISEVELQALTIDQKARTEAQRELRSVEAKLAELTERRTAAKDRLGRMDLRAPRSGIIHELAVHTVGGVISAAEPVLLIVPKSDNLTVEARFAATDIDQLTVGHPAKIRFSAFNQRTTPELAGHITHVAADVTKDPKTGERYYLGRLDLDDGARREIGDRQLLPGMPAEIFITTTQRTAFSYFAKPFTDQLTRAFREE